VEDSVMVAETRSSHLYIHISASASPHSEIKLKQNTEQNSLKQF